MGKRGFATSFRELEVYQNALELADGVHRLCGELPREELYSLADQARRASRSVCANIAEAWRKRRYKAAFVAKLSDAETEAAEMQCWLDLAMRFAYVSRMSYENFDKRYEHVIAQILTMIKNADRWCTL